MMLKDHLKNSGVKGLKQFILLFQGRVPFQVPEAVPWIELAQMLSTKFKAMTGRELSESNLTFLAGKLFGNSGTDFSTAMVSWSQFYKVDSLFQLYCEKMCV